MELIDLYDENRIPLGRQAERRAPRKSGEHLLVIHVCIFNQEGQMLIQQRAKEKAAWAGWWDVSAAGAVAAGENCRKAAEREVREELGYDLDLTGIRPSATVNFEGGFDDFFLVEREVDITSLTLQKEEVSAVRWASREEVLEMMEEKQFITYPKSFVEFLFDMRNTFGF